MERHDLWIFKHVAEMQSISKAAERLGYVQPNVSQRIKSLEDELGIRLFIRNNRGVTLTEPGKVLLDYTNKILLLMDEAKSLINPQKWKKTLIIGASQTISAVKIPHILSSFLKDHKDIEVKVRTTDGPKLQEMLYYGEIDGMFINGMYENSHFKTVYSYVEKMILISPEPIEIDKPQDQTIIINSDPTCIYRNKMIEFLAKKNLQNPTFMEFDSLETILRAVHDGLGMSILPADVLDWRIEEPITQFHEINETIKVDFVIQHRKQQHQSLKNFIRFLQST